jgi:GWxTD domain-containing protein
MIMKKYFLLISVLFIFMASCTNYTVNVSTIPAEPVEIYLNEEYRGTTNKDGNLTFKIKEVSFADDQFIEAKKENYRGFLTVNYSSNKYKTQNVLSVDRVDNKSSISHNDNIFNAIFIIPEREGVDIAGAQAFEDEPLSQVASIQDEYSMTEAELDKYFETCLYISNRADRKKYKKLALPIKREFINNFWKTQDKSPETELNEFKLEYLKKVTVANQRFSYAKKDGWKTDQGRILILYGEPSDVERFRMNNEQKEHEIWHYYQIAGGVQFYFVAVRSIRDLRLVHSTASGELFDPDWERWLSN